ncbi:hypothetical protein PBCVNEJV1_463L [Paramecium bursaria Chlorella virus NE-JV-1]|nr:hypothetical protein PBCVNEJV1_463L [Paramecium bursaria Chlorella virus NE-JV-1]
MDSQFVRVITEAVNGVKKLEDCAEVLVSAAIDDVLLRVAQDYSLDFTKLIADYKEDVVDTHAKLSTGKIMCRGTTTVTKKKCSKRAVSGGYCRAHISQGIAKQEIAKHAKEYSDLVHVQEKTSDLTVALEKMNISVLDSKHFKVSKSEITDFF